MHFYLCIELALPHLKWDRPSVAFLKVNFLAGVLCLLQWHTLGEWLTRFAEGVSILFFP